MLNFIFSKIKKKYSFWMKNRNISYYYDIGVLSLKNRPLRAAIVGVGKMGLVRPSILNTLPDVELVAICDKSSFIRKFSAKLLGEITVVDDVAKLSSFDVDIFYITSLIPSHYYVAKEICSNRKPVNIFVEKTLSSNFDESLALCSIVQDCKVQHGWLYEEIRRYVQQG